MDRRQFLQIGFGAATGFAVGYEGAHAAGKALHGLWRSGTGGQWYRTGLSFSHMVDWVNLKFKDGYRLVDMVGAPSSGWHAVVRAGTGGQHWVAGLTIGEFKFLDADLFKQGLRIRAANLRHGDGRVTAIWRKGAGAQLWQDAMTWSEFKTVDAKNFDKGLRVVAIEKYHNQDKWFAVWRSGTGAQWISADPNEEPSKEMQAQVLKGLRVTTMGHGIEPNNPIVFRPGTGKQSYSHGATVDGFKQIDANHFANGMRLIYMSYEYQ